MESNVIRSDATVQQVSDAARKLRDVIQFHLDQFQNDFLVMPKIYTITEETANKCGLNKTNRVIVEVYF
jgi:sulfur relay (sulfurtransferase) DsrC/TusE family protein